MFKLIYFGKQLINFGQKKYSVNLIFMLIIISEKQTIYNKSR